VGYASASGDLELLADVIDHGLKKDTVWSGGNLTLYADWLDVLPPQAFHSRPALSLNASHILYLVGRFDLAEKQIDQAEQTLQSLPSSPEKEQMLALASLYRGSIASVRGDTQLAIEKITYAQQRLPQENHLHHARGFFSLGLAYELSGQAELAVQNYLKSSEEAQSARVLSLAIHALGSAAQVQINQGQLSKAAQACHKAIYIAEGKQFPALGLAEIILGNIALERNDLAAAEELLQNGVALSRRGGVMDDLILGLSYLARVHAYQGRTSNVFEVAEEVNTIMQGFGVERMSMIAAAYIAYLQLLTGQEEPAKKWAKEYQSVRDGQSHEIADLTLVRVLLKTGESKEIPSVLEPLIKQKQAQGQVRSAIESMMLMALYHRAEKDIPSAVDWLSQALELAAPEGFIRIFLDKKESLLDLLQKTRQTAPELVDAIMGIRQAESDSPPSPFDQLIDPLSEQELRILKLLTAGKSNKEIADELVISVGTAKWHVHNILQKLGVSNRSQVILRAKELGL